MDIDTLLAQAKALIMTKTNVPLNYLQEAILRGTMQGDTYSKIADETYNSEAHVRDKGAELWKNLSKALGTKVTKKNFRAVVKNIKSSYFPTNIVTDVHQSNFTINNNLSICPNKKDPAPFSPSSSSHQTILDLTDAPTFTSLYPRPTEIETLQKFILEDKTRILTILGLSGIGKTALTLTLIEQIKPQFDYIIYRTLDTSPTLEKLLKSLLQFCHQNTENQLPEQIDEMREYLLNFLRCHRCLIVLDDVHNILSSRELVGNYQPDKTNYSKFFKQIAEFCHQSCLMLISWEPPIDIISLSHQNPLVKTFSLPGLAPTMITEMWREMGLQDEEKWLDIINLYQGNPVWLNLFAQTIQDLFNHSVAEFTELETRFLPTEVVAILQQHWQRLSDIELKIMQILTTATDGLHIKEITQKIKLDQQVSAPISDKLINAIRSLTQRGLIEKKQQNKRNIFILLPILQTIP